MGHIEWFISLCSIGAELKFEISIMEQDSEQTGGETMDDVKVDYSATVTKQTHPETSMQLDCESTGHSNAHELQETKINAATAVPHHIKQSDDKSKGAAASLAFDPMDAAAKENASLSKGSASVVDHKEGKDKAIHQIDSKGEEHIQIYSKG